MTTKMQSQNYGVGKLKFLLQSVTQGDEPKALVEKFNEIAQCIFGEVEIVKGNKKYDILEIEFYYFSPNYPQPHNDKDKSVKVTYERKADAGDWFFHERGMDLCFKSDTEAYGGILIRSIKEESATDPILGPGRVCAELFTVYNAFENLGYEENMPRIVDKQRADGKADEAIYDTSYRYHIADRKLCISDKLRYTIKNFIELYSNCKGTGSYFDIRRLGYSRKDAEDKIKNHTPLPEEE